MKKTIIMKASVILTSVIMASANVISVSAADTETIRLSDTQAVAGKMASVTMSMDTNDACAAYEILVEYDSELELERVIGANAYNAFDNYVALVGYTADTYKDNKPVVTLQFTIPDDAQTGQSYEVKFSEIRTFASIDFEYENYESYNGTIEILEETKKTS